MAAPAFSGFPANGRSRVSPPALMGTQEPAGQSKVERQQTERTGRWLCICQQAGFYLNRPLRLNRVHHPGQSQLYAGLLPFKFSGCPAAGCPEEPFRFFAPMAAMQRYESLLQMLAGFKVKLLGLQCHAVYFYKSCIGGWGWHNRTHNEGHV